MLCKKLLRVALLLMLVTGCLGICVFPVAAQGEAILLSDAIANGQVTITSITGNSSYGTDYSQPLLQIQLNATATMENVTIAPGTELHTDTGTSMVALAFHDMPQPVNAGDNSIGLIAFTTDVSSYPKNDVRCTVGNISSNAKLVDLLKHILSEGGGTYKGTELAPQLAVWQVASDKTFADVNEQILGTFGYSLAGDPIENRAAQLIDGSTGVSAASETNQETASSADGNQGTGGSSDQGQDSPSPLPLVVIAVIVFGIAGGIVFYFVKTGSRSTQSVTNTPDITNAPPKLPNQPSSVSQPQVGSPEYVAPGGGRDNIRTSPMQSDPGRRSGKTVSLVQKTPPPASTPPDDKPKQEAGMHTASDDKQKAGVQTEPFNKPKYAERTAPHAPGQQKRNQLREPQLHLVPLGDGANTKKPVIVPSHALITRTNVLQAEIQHNNATVSSPHCVISFMPDRQWIISDLASLHGTFINGKRIDQKKRARQPLATGNIITLGSVRLRFSWDEKNDSASLEQLNDKDQVIETYHSDRGTPYWVITGATLSPVVLSDQHKHVSAPHAVVAFEDGWTIRDLSSSNGTFLKRKGKDSDEPRLVENSPKRVLLHDTLFIADPSQYEFTQPDLGKIGSYTLTAWAGRGGMADVFLAHDANTQRQLVVKVLTDKSDIAKSLFVGECEIMKVLQSIATVVPYIAHGTDEKYGDYLVLEYIKGATLRSILRAVPKQTIEKSIAIQIIRAVCAALQALHQHNKAHCDVKPNNILNSVRLFGAAVLE